MILYKFLLISGNQNFKLFCIKLSYEKYKQSNIFEWIVVNISILCECWIKSYDLT